MKGHVDLCISYAERREGYLFVVRKFNVAMLIMRKKDYTDDDIMQFQMNIGDFFQVWVKLHSEAGCTNYIHMLSSGHIAEYMFRWRNLHRFSQQGWEHFNLLLKVFFCRTQHGGHVGWREQQLQLGATKNKLRLIGRWLLRQMLWICGIGDILFECSGDYEETQVQHNAPAEYDLHDTI